MSQKPLLPHSHPPAHTPQKGGPLRAPHVYRPQPVPKVLQTKAAMGVPKPNPPVNRFSSSVRSVHGPHSNTKVVQPKAVSARPSPVVQPRQLPKAPPAYHPHPTPKVLQAKLSIANRQPGVRPGGSPPAPPVYRPQAAPKVLQRKTVNAKHQGHTHPVAPPVYRPLPKKIVQPKIAQPKQLAPSALRGDQAGSAKQRQAGTVQMYREVPVGYLNSGPSQEAYQMRMHGDVPPGRNIATFSFKARPPKMGPARANITAASTGFYDPASNHSHSEKQIINGITPLVPFTSALFKDEVVNWVYTERRPCPRCGPELRRLEENQKLMGWDGDTQYPYDSAKQGVDLTVYFSFEKQEAKRQLKLAMQQAGKNEDAIDDEVADVETGESTPRPGNWGTHLRDFHVSDVRDRVQDNLERAYVESGDPEEYDTVEFDSYPEIARQTAENVVPQFEVGITREEYERRIQEQKRQHFGTFY